MRPFVYDIALTVGFRGLTRRSGIVFEGPAGWAEWSPFPEYDDVEAVAWLAAAREAADVGFPVQVRDVVEVNGIVPALDPAAAAARAIASGCRTIKIKVAARHDTIADDVARVRAVRDALPSARLRVDANGGWSLDEATEAMSALASFGLEYAEQPCADVADLAALRRRELGVKIAADESIRRVEDPLRVAELGAADLAVLKVQPLGGVRACLRLAEKLEMPVVVSSAVETSVGLRAGLALAAALPTLDYACGLETAKLLAGDVTRDPLAPVDGSLSVRPVLVDAELLARNAAGPELTHFWLDRLERVSSLLEEDR